MGEIDVGDIILDVIHLNDASVKLEIGKDVPLPQIYERNDDENGYADLQEHINRALEAAKHNPKRISFKDFLKDAESSGKAMNVPQDFSMEMILRNPESFWGKKNYRYAQGEQILVSPRGNCEVVIHDTLKEAGENSNSDLDRLHALSKTARFYNIKSYLGVLKCPECGESTVHEIA